MNGGASLGLDGRHLGHLNGGGIFIGVDHAKRRPKDRLVGQGIALDLGTLGQFYDVDGSCQNCNHNYTLTQNLKSIPRKIINLKLFPIRYKSCRGNFNARRT